MKWVPKIVYGSGPTTLSFTQVQKVWTPGARPIGGSGLSDAGVPEAYIVRRDQLCRVEIRFLESEWVAVDTWLAAVQSGASFDYWFDQTDITTKYTVYLEEPKLGNGEVKLSRDKYTKILSLPVVIRTTAQNRFDVRIF